MGSVMRERDERVMELEKEGRAPRRRENRA